MRFWQKDALRLKSCEEICPSDVVSKQNLAAELPRRKILSD
jgi:hypothetical protein